MVVAYDIRFLDRQVSSMKFLSIQRSKSSCTPVQVFENNESLTSHLRRSGSHDIEDFSIRRKKEVERATKIGLFDFLIKILNIERH